MNNTLAAVEGVAPVARVLVVDDDPDINRLLRTRLTARGFTVDSAANGEEGLERIAQGSPDVVFLDVSMPGVGGLEVLERVRTARLDLAVIMTTAFGSEKVAIDALRLGADEYLRKPFEREEFTAVLDRTVRRLELGRQNAALRRQLDEKRQQLEAELARAARVQADLLPRGAPDLPGYEMAALCVPAREVGGDFYDWLMPGNGTLVVTLGDVMGKGMPAALLMATVRAALRAVSHEHLPGEAVALAARALEEDLDRSGSFLTLFHTRLDAPSGQLRFVDAGHGHVFVHRRDDSVETLDLRSLPIGVSLGERPGEGIISLGPGDALILYSDGLIDARADMPSTPAELAEYLIGCRDAASMVERLAALARPDDAPAELPDDLTILALRRHDA